MNIIDGDLVKMADLGKFDIIIHGCNCFHTMGAGIAKEIATRWPEALEADRTTGRGSEDKLGNFSLALVQNRVHGKLLIINLYTQHRYGRDKCYFEYDAFREGLRSLRQVLPKGYRIGMPMIGAGLGGGDWRVISSILDNEFEGLDYTVIRYHGRGRW